ncbi:MAG: hypothetical protein M5U01_01080 [Ardenticatenaceae bacterium]|nr:hypothetical protein [Ardenticatenaceae bacterium]
MPRSVLRIPRGVLLAILVTVPAMLPFLHSGYWESHDGLFHLFRLLSLEQAPADGVLYPRLFPDFAFGYGHAVLNYYPPLTYYVGLVLRWLGLGPVEAMKTTFALGYPLAALAIYRLARDLWASEPGAVLAVGVYTYLPYRLADVQLRGALAESWAFVWMPLALWAALRRRPVWLALSLAALVLTHNLSALLFAPLFALWLAVSRMWPEVPGRRFGTAAAWALAVGTGALLSAFYWLPMALEARWVHLALDVGGRGFERHLQPLSQWVARGLIYHYFPEQGVAGEHPLGWVQILILALAMGASVLAWVQLRRSERAALVVLWLVLAGSLFMLTSSATPLWRLLAFPLGMVQYPWRWLTLTTLATALLAGLIARAAAGRTLPETPGAGGEPPLYFGEELEEVPFDKDAMIASLRAAGHLGAAPKQAQQVAWAAALALPALLATTTLPALPWASLAVDPAAHPQAMWQVDYENEQIGATWTAEYLPRWVGEERWAIPRPVGEESSGATAAALEAGVHIRAVQLNRVNGWQMDLDVALEAPGEILLHQFYLPAWQATVDGRPVAVTPRGRLALASVTVPAGIHRVVVGWRATTAVRWGLVLTGLGVAALVGLLLLTAVPRTILIVAALLIAVGLLGSTRLDQAQAGAGTLHQLDARVGNQALLLGWQPVHPVAQVGRPFDLTLHWLNLRTTPADYKVFVHLTATDSPVPLAQSDGDPGAGYTPTSRWLAGELIPDLRHLMIPPDLPPGAYDLWAGLYDLQTGERLPVAERGDGRVLLGTITVRPAGK